LIFGASGFIGTHLVSAAAKRGYEVIALSRSGAAPSGAARAYAWSLGQPAPEEACRGAACAIHLAHDFDGEAGARRTFESTQQVVRQLRQVAVRRQLFFSSYSAGAHSSSLYGNTKLALERCLAEQPDVVIIRPGLVLGDGGIYGRIRRAARVLPVVPLPDGGQGRVPVIEIEQLCEWTIELAADPDAPAEANLFEPGLKSLRELVLQPSRPLMALLTLAAHLRIPLPVKADNLAGFLANQQARHAPTPRIKRS
jgi:nucleoside-diphosphate-sugar epimerase